MKMTSPRFGAAQGGFDESELNVHKNHIDCILQSHWLGSSDDTSFWDDNDSLDYYKAMWQNDKIGPVEQYPASQEEKRRGHIERVPRRNELAIPYILWIDKNNEYVTADK